MRAALDGLEARLAGVRADRDNALALVVQVRMRVIFAPPPQPLYGWSLDVTPRAQLARRLAAQGLNAPAHERSPRHGESPLSDGADRGPSPHRVRVSPRGAASGGRSGGVRARRPRAHC